MTDEEIQIVQKTFDKVRPVADQVAAMFYARLFEIDPTARPLFKGDMTEQGKKLMQMLAIAVGGLKNPAAILQAVRDLGRRHKGYNVTEAHYDTVGAALLWTFGQGLGDEFTPEVEAAWTSAYTLLAGEMKAAARGQAPDAEQLAAGGPD
jgi:hemoglobin-like flavoprotein